MYIAQGRLNSAVPPCLAAGCLARHALFWPLVARLTAPLLRQCPFRSLLRSERLALAKVKRLTAHDLFSLKPGAADQTLSVNALAKMIAQGNSRVRRNARRARICLGLHSRLRRYGRARRHHPRRHRIRTSFRRGRSLLPVHGPQLPWTRHDIIRPRKRDGGLRR